MLLDQYPAVKIESSPFSKVQIQHKPTKVMHSVNLIVVLPPPQIICFVDHYKSK